MVIIPYLLWWKAVDKSRFFEIFVYGLLIVLITGLLDAIGVENDAWDYEYDLVPLLDVFIVYDISILPVTFMLAYQYFKTWRSFIVAHILIAAVFAYVFEPLLIWLDIYHPAGWKHTYSFIGYVLIALCMRWFMLILLRKVKRSRFG